MPNKNAGIEAGKKPLDKAIEACIGYPVKGACKVIFIPTEAHSHIKKLESENVILKKENKMFKKQLRKFGQVFDNYSKNKKEKEIYGGNRNLKKFILCLKIDNKLKLKELIKNQKGE